LHGVFRVFVVSGYILSHPKELFRVSFAKCSERCRVASLGGFNQPFFNGLVQTSREETLLNIQAGNR
jgi:hypothetical protein